ncbi:PepSY-associated TM helix domain-containing protein [Algiphilus aromaticivorans]|uniref:PepSY-associated TM helix domain-containing protein n=1 Tax=Algiphilus aromaticivorans TaxID=382454 RepID=UPI0005C212B4|nr:PepSY-associated TM helix domain-containing protein [Algiphilus aromaticivorans]
MKRSLRQSLSLVHTWSGVLFGGLLFLIFFMGTLSVFDDEVDRWMMPGTRAIATADTGYDAALATVLAQPGAAEEAIFIAPPDARRPVYRARHHGPDDTHLTTWIDPASGDVLQDPGTLGASGFFFPLHFGLHLDYFGISAVGYWIVGLTGMITLVGLIAGVVIHRRIFRDFFSFRPERSRGRALLDLHNIGGVMLLPFLAVITLSGVLIFAHVHMPAGIFAVYPDREAFFHDAFPHPDREPAGEPAEMASIDTMIAEADRVWGGGRPLSIGVFHAGDANAYVAMYRYTGESISYDYEQLTFDGVTGELMHHQKLGPAMATYQFISGLHLAMFDHWPILWLYFLMGLGSCAVIGSGFLVWLDKRARSAGNFGYRLVQATGSATTVGLMLATVAMLAANRLLPAAQERATTEILIFFGVWAASLPAAWWRAGLANLRLQLALLAAGLLALPILNAASTGDHLLRTLARGDWAVAGSDLVFLTLGGAAALAAHALSPERKPVTAQRAAQASG